MELAAEAGHELPTNDAEALGAWFAEAADSGSLVRYLETFEHTFGVMQSASALSRVARECAEDLAADGVVYAEVRYARAPRPGRTDPRPGGRRRAGGLRPGRRGERWADRRTTAADGDAPGRAVPRDRRARDQAPRPGVAGFDIAGPEAGYPPTRFLDAFDYVRRENGHITIHAGEAFGLPSIWEAVQWCGADRLGHGVRIIDDIRKMPGRRYARTSRARPARVVRPRQADPARDVPSSNLRPAPRLDRANTQWDLADLRFRVTVNTDNGLISGTSMTKERQLLCEAFGWGLHKVSG